MTLREAYICVLKGGKVTNEAFKDGAFYECPEYDDDFLVLYDEQGAELYFEELQGYADGWIEVTYSKKDKS